MKVFKFLHIPTAQYVKMWRGDLFGWADIENPTYNDAKLYLHRTYHLIVQDEETEQIRKLYYVPDRYIPEHEISIVEVEHKSDLLTGHLTKHVS